VTVDEAMKKIKANGTRKKMAVPMMAMVPMTMPRVFFIVPPRVGSATR
jgi:hypothetical protein